MQDWVEEFAVTRSAPPVVLTLFCTQYPATVLNRTSVGLPVPRWAVRWSKVIPLELSAMTAGRPSLFWNRTELAV